MIPISGESLQLGLGSVSGESLQAPNKPNEAENEPNLAEMAVVQELHIKDEKGRPVWDDAPDEGRADTGTGIPNEIWHGIRQSDSEGIEGCLSVAQGTNCKRLGSLTPILILIGRLEW